MANSPMDAAAIVQAYLSSPQFLNTIANIVQGASGQVQSAPIAVAAPRNPIPVLSVLNRNSAPVFPLTIGNNGQDMSGQGNGLAGCSTAVSQAVQHLATARFVARSSIECATPAAAASSSSDRSGRVTGRNRLFKKDNAVPASFFVTTSVLEEFDPKNRPSSTVMDDELTNTGFAEVVIEYNVRDSEEDVRRKTVAGHYDMLNPLRGGIRMYHNTSRGQCTLITPFPEYIPTGRRLQRYKNIFIGRVCQDETFEDLLRLSPTLDPLCLKCRNRINLLLMERHYIQCEGTYMDGVTGPVNRTPLVPVGTPMTSIASRAQTRRMPLGMNIPLDSDSDSDFMPPARSRRRIDSSTTGDHEHAGPSRETMSSSTRPLGQELHSVPELLLPQVIDRPVENLEGSSLDLADVGWFVISSHLEILNRSARQRGVANSCTNPWTFPSSDILGGALDAINNPGFMSNTHNRMRATISGDEIASDCGGPSRYVYTTMSELGERGVEELHNHFLSLKAAAAAVEVAAAEAAAAEAPAAPPLDIPEGVGQEEDEATALPATSSRLFAYGFFAGLAILHEHITPEWVLHWTREFYEPSMSHPFVSGLDRLELVPMLMNNVAVQSLFKPENWDFETTAACFKQDRSAPGVSFIEKAEDQSYGFFMEFLNQVTNGEVSVDSGPLTAKMVYQYCTSSWVMMRDSKRRITVNFLMSRNKSPMLPIAGSCFRKLTLPLVLNLAEMSTAWVTAFNVEGGTRFTRG